jgi:hypothetical protein
MRCFRLRAKRRNAGKLRLDKRVHLRFFQIQLPFVAAKLQMHGARHAGRRGAKGLPQHVGNARHVVDGDVHFCHRFERGDVVNLLIDLAKFCLRIAPAGHRDDRRMRQIGIAQAGREIESPDHLRHADAGLAARARIAIGHVSRRFFAMAMHARDLGPPLHFGKGSPQHGGHHEHVRDAVACQHLGKHLGADAFEIVSDTRHQAGSNFSATPLMQ